MEVRKSGTPCFLCRSLLLSTTILNDTITKYVLKRIKSQLKFATKGMLSSYDESMTNQLS